MMGKDSTKANKRNSRHDPLHTQLADNPEHGMRKPTRQKFIDRNNKEDEVEVRKQTTQIPSTVVIPYL
jgi:essential nuclear protein 1